MLRRKNILMTCILFTPPSFAEVTSVIVSDGTEVIMSDDVVNNANSGDVVSSSGAGSVINTNGFNISTEGNNISSVTASAGGVVNVSNSVIKVSGASSNGVSAQADGVVNINESVINVDGENAKGIFGGDGTVIATNTQIVTSGEKSYGIGIDGASSSFISFNNGKITTSGTRSHGVLANTGTINLKSSSINTSGDGARGLDIAGDATIYLDDVSITTLGDDRADGIVVSGSVIGDNVSVAAHGQTSYGITMAEDGYLNLSNSTIISDHYAALDYTVQASLNGAEANFYNSSLYGYSSAVLAIGADGVLNMNGSTADSVMGSLAQVADGRLDIYATNGSMLNGTTSIGTDGELNLNLSDNSSWISNGNSKLTTLDINDSNIYFSKKGSEVVGRTLTITDSLASNEGVFYLNSALGGDNSLTDKLIINGDTSGSAYLNVSNIGGLGAPTVDGIEIVHVEGDSAGTFSLSGRAVGGAYEYLLSKGNGSNKKNWYLKNTNDKGDLILRPEGGSYIENISTANTLFNLSLADRLGESEYIDVFSGEKKTTTMWMRQSGNHNRWHDNSNQLRNTTNRYVIQMGGDIVSWSNDDSDRWHIGAMTGYGNQKSKTISKETGFYSKGDTDGYSTGLYLSWFENDDEKRGAYFDSWVQYNWFNHSVNGQHLNKEKYKSSGFITSAETGYDYRLSNLHGNLGSTYEFYIRPQAQMIWSSVRADNVTEASGVTVKSKGHGNIMSRLGVRTYLKGHHKSDENSDREFEPFIEANWVHNTREYQTEFGRVSVKQSGAKNLAEIKVGLDGKMSNKLNVWGNVGVDIGGSGYSDTSAMIGVKIIL